MYRTKYFEKEIPQTWDELLKKLIKIKKEKEKNNKPFYNGIIFQGNNYEGLICMFFELLWARGGDIYPITIKSNIEGSLIVKYVPEFDDKDIKDTLKFMHDLIYKHEVVPKEVFTFDEALSLNYFINNDCVLLRNWPFAFHIIQNDDRYWHMRGKVDVFPKPLHFAGAAKKCGKMVLGGWGFAITSTSDKKIPPGDLSVM